MYDIGIIGGGLGGLTLAIQMAQKGWKTILIEKKDYPFHRVCGEYVAQESWDFLERLGFDRSQYNLPIINQLLVSAPNGKVLKSSLTTGGMGISRHLLDESLFRIALENGVIIRTNTTVRDYSKKDGFWFLETKNESLKCKAVVGAFGKRSNLDQTLKRDYLKDAPNQLNNFVGVKYHLKGNFKTNQIELHNFEGGYCGLSKVEEDILCMCYLVKGSVFHKEGNIQNFENNILSKNPFLQEYLKYERLWEKPLSIAKVDFSKKNIIENDIPMIGDAAGLIAPLSGNGMSMSMHASFLIAQLIHQFLKEEISWNQLLLEYHQLWSDTFQNRLRVGRLLQQSFGKTSLTNMMIQFLKHSSFITEKIIASTHGVPF